MSALTHPIPAEWLTAYHDGELDARRRQQVEAHLPECAECRRELEALQALRQVLASEPVPAARTTPEAFWRGVQTQLPERPAAAAHRKLTAAPVGTSQMLLRWSPGILLLLLNGVVQVAAVGGAAFLLLATALQWTPAWAVPMLQLVSGLTLGLPTWLLPANWGGWELLGFWLIVTAELGVLYVAWLGYELRYGPFAIFERAMALRGA